MSKKFILSLFVFLCICITAAVYILHATKEGKQSKLSSEPSPTLAPSVPQTVLRLMPNPAEPDSQGHIDVYVSADTQGNSITGAEFELEYDPTALTFVAIEPDDAFYNAQEVIKKIDEKEGKIHYAVGLTPQQAQEPVQGNDHVVEISFLPKHTGQTNITFLRAMVSSQGIPASVLKETHDTTVLLNLADEK